MTPRIQDKQRRLALLAGMVVGLLAKKQKKISIESLEYRTSTQRMGISFSEKIRCFWRKKWIYLKNQDKSE
jgi:hypothetical protein